MIEHARLLELLHYDPLTGRFTWLVNRGRSAKKGQQAGSIDKDGYLVITFRIAGKCHNYFGHRLAWFYVHGVWPEGDLDHGEMDKADNRLDELREATRSQNMANTRAHQDNLTGTKGVSLDKRRGTYSARIMKDGEVHWLGTHPDVESASRAYAEAAVRLFGEFARAS